MGLAKNINEYAGLSKKSHHLNEKTVNNLYVDY
jgi:hypothetical protein